MSYGVAHVSNEKLLFFGDIRRRRRRRRKVKKDEMWKERPKCRPAILTKRVRGAAFFFFISTMDEVSVLSLIK